MVRRYEPADLAAVNAWYAARGRAGLPSDAVPQLGAIVPEVAAGFLYRTDSSVALLDSFITNPAARLLKRGRAVREIASVLIDLARTQGCRRLVVLSASHGIGGVARSLGFGPLGSYALLAREV